MNTFRRLLCTHELYEFLSVKGNWDVFVECFFDSLLDEWDLQLALMTKCSSFLMAVKQKSD